VPYRLIPVAKGLIWAGASMQVGAGVLMAQAPPPPPGQSQGLAAVIFALSGLFTVVLGFLSQQLEARRKARDLQGQLERQAAELASLRGVAAQTTAIAQTNTARVAGIQGGQEGLIETLQSKGVVDVPGGPHDRYGMRSTMLIVEDDAATARQLMRLFMKLGFYATHAATVDDALEQLAEPSKRTHWLVLDLNLGPGNGLEVLRYIRRLGLAPPRVAVLTGEDDPARLRDVEALKPDVLLLKPIAFKELVTKINPNLAPPEAGEVVQ
jgi:CheY-like chemotaxis protein